MAYLGDFEQPLVVEHGLARGLVGAHELGEHHGGEVADGHLQKLVVVFTW